MRKLILSLAVSLDGFIEGPNGEYDWCFTDQDYGLSNFMKSIDAVFLGRKTYEMAQGMGGGGGGMSRMQTYVFSNTLERVKKGAVLVQGDLHAEVQKIKQQSGKDIWLFGGAGLTVSLMQHRLIDEIHLGLHPVLLGGGKPLFRDIQERTRLRLLHSNAFSTGLVLLKYEVLTQDRS